MSRGEGLLPLVINNYMNCVTDVRFIGISPGHKNGSDQVLQQVK